MPRGAAPRVDTIDACSCAGAAASRQLIDAESTMDVTRQIHSLDVCTPAHQGESETFSGYIITT
jgi:hypothetical protein